MHGVYDMIVKQTETTQKNNAGIVHLPLTHGTKVGSFSSLHTFNIDIFVF